ncbi:hypothetical protein U9M48_029259 [Paspalum notatum var. saurae]|uniref:Protein EXORDIUM n=1 Tax=Paspalum notatum var. saurae TaxID=547442 RepID=A0AAQ3TZ29_PASNO
MASRAISISPKTMLTTTLILLLTILARHASADDRRELDLVETIAPGDQQLTYHGGAVLRGDIPVSIVWYGNFTSDQKSIVLDFINSLTSTPPPASSSSTSAPSVAQWWSTIHGTYLSNVTTGGGATRVVLGTQVADEACSLGRSLTLSQVAQLAAGARPARGGLALVLTDADVVVAGFGSVRCGLHGAAAGDAGYAYAWAGDAARQCPGQCAWPFAAPAYGPPDSKPLGAPNGDVGADGMMVTLASMVAGAVTNPFGDAYYQGEKDAALEACTACAGVYGSGSYPGYAGNVLVDAATGGSYNAVGAGGHKYLLPAVYDPAKPGCSTLVAILMVPLVLASLSPLSLGARRVPPDLTEATETTPLGEELSYHGGAVLHGDIPVSIVWYGQFKPAQKAILVDFLLSLTSSPAPANATTPSAAQWWRTIDRAYLSNATSAGNTANTTRVLLAGQVTDERYSLGKSLTLVEVFQLAAALVPPAGALVLVLTDPGVAVEGLCSSRCGLHGADDAGAGYAYAWVGDAEAQCPGQCAWPFAAPAYGPRGPGLPPLAPPNGDVGVDGMVATLATVMAGAVTNPMGDGYYMGDKDAALEACSACAGRFGSGAYPGNPGKVLVDETTGGSYNAVGANGRKYLLPAIFDPATSDCSTNKTE